MNRAMTYRKRSDVAKAIQVTPLNYREVAKWCGGRIVEETTDRGKSHSIIIATFEGNVRANPGDWVLQNAQGEFTQYNQAAFDEDYVRA